MSVKVAGPNVEGGAFRCGLHGDKEFVTSDVNKWLEHIAKDGDHTMSGQKPCGLCGTMHKFEDEPAGLHVFCPNCKKAIIKQSQKESSKAKK